MRKTIITFILLATSTMAGNAQYFAEGSFSLNFDKEKTNEVESKGSGYAIRLSPQVGYRLNDKISVGTGIALNLSNSKQTDSDREVKNFSWQVSAFSQYKLWGTEKFSLLLDGLIYYIKGDKEDAVNDFLATGKFEDDVYEHK